MDRFDPGLSSAYYRGGHWTCLRRRSLSPACVHWSPPDTFGIHVDKHFNNILASDARSSRLHWAR